MEEWKEYKALDFCYNVTDGTHDSPKPKEEGYYLITSKHLKDNGIDFASAKKISEEDYLKVIQRSKVEQYDILYSMIGTIGNICQVKDEKVDFAVKNMGIFKMGGDELKSKWLYYWLKSPMSIHYVSSRLAGSTQSYLTLNSLREYPVLVPSNEKTMKRIVSILSSLDDKIEVNRRINEQLEELAQALFKSWFVDFEPFKDGEFVESELGMIPKGWKVGTLGDVAMITKGTTPTTLGYSFTYNGIPFIKAESIRDNHTIDFDKTTYISSEANEKLCRSIIKKYDILFTIAGTLGRFCFAPQTLEIANTNQAVAIIRVHKLFNPISIYSMLLGKWHTEYCYRNIQQAVQANLSLGTLKKMPILIPPFDIIKKYEECIFPIFMKFESLNEEITHLTNLRDTLLPKLMSGDIDVNDVEI